MTSQSHWAETVYQGALERIPYTFDAALWNITVPTGVTLTVWQVTPGGLTNVSATVVSGSASVSGSVITLPIIQSLVNNVSYLGRLQFANNSVGTYELLIPIVGQE